MSNADLSRLIVGAMPASVGTLRNWGMCAGAHRTIPSRPATAWFAAA
jgi:hypothetical protein